MDVAADAFIAERGIREFEGPSSLLGDLRDGFAQGFAVKREHVVSPRQAAWNSFGVDRNELGRSRGKYDLFVDLCGYGFASARE